MTEDEMRHVVRRDLNLHADVLSEGALDALWRALDCRGRGCVTTAEFIMFMRKNYVPSSTKKAEPLSDAYDERYADYGGVHKSQRTYVLETIAAAFERHANRCGDDW